MSQDYVYSVATDFTGGLCNESNLVTEIKASSIATPFVGMVRNSDVLTLTFETALLAGEKTTLDGDTSNPAGGLIAANDPNTVPNTSAEGSQIRTPPTFSAHQHNYNPLGFDQAGMLRISSTAAFNITGMLAGGAGRVIRIHNVGSFNITFKKENASSSAVNRLASTSDIVVTPDSQISLQYDGTTSRWRALSGGGAGGDLVGTFPEPQVAQSSRAFGFTSVIEPASISADTNDYNPTGLSAANTIRLSAQSPGFTITGLVGGADGRVLFLYNAGNNPIVLANASSSSTTTNRFLFGGTSGMVLMPNQGAIIQYDGTANRWRSPGSETSSELAGQVVFSGEITPPALSNNTNNYNPTGLANSAVLRLSADTPGYNLTGIQGGLEGRILILHNVGSFPVTLKNDATSSTTYRFLFASDIVLSTDQSLIVHYDSTVNRWRCLARQIDPYGSTANTICQGNDSRLSDSRTPTSHASTHQPGGSDTMAVDAAAGTGSLRTIGTGALQACAGNDSRLSTPAAHAASHQPGGGDALAVDAAAGTGSLRTVGTGALQACAGNDARLSDDRTATGVRTASTVVAVSGAAAPSAGQVLTAINSTSASWQTATGGAASDLSTTGAAVNVSGAAPPTTGQALVATSATTATWQGVTASPAGSTTQVQYNNAGALGGAANLAINAAGYPTIGEATTAPPATPSAGSTLFSQFRVGRRLPASIGPNGAAFELQPGLMGRKVALYVPRGNSTTADSWGFGATVSGTATSRTVATTNLSTSLRRIGFVSSATAGNAAGVRGNATQFWQGNATGLGGFFYLSKFIISQTNATVRWFVGLSGTAAALANADPSTLFNLVGFSIDSAQTTIRLINNDGSGAATTADQGANFPATTTTAVYEIRLFCAPNTTEIFWSIERIDSAFFATGSVTTNIPTNTTLLSPQIWINNGSTASAIAIDVVNQYMETDL